MQHKERKIPIGYVAQSTMIAWGKSHVNLQKALEEKEVEEHIQAIFPELLYWAKEKKVLVNLMTAYIGNSNKDFSDQARSYLLRRFVEATANGILFEGKSAEQVESETIFSQNWINKMIHEAVEEIKQNITVDMRKFNKINLAIAITLGTEGFTVEGKCSPGESANNGSVENDGQCETL